MVDDGRITSPDDDASRARQVKLASIRRELSAPVSAVVEYGDMLAEELARWPGLIEMEEDLDRLRRAAANLLELVNDVLEFELPKEEGAGAGGLLENAQSRLRHALREPLNVIKGYAELMLEDLESGDADILTGDLRRLLDEVDRLLAHIDRIVDLSEAHGDAVAAEPSAPLSSEDISGLVQSIRPVAPDGKRRVATGRILIVDDNESNRTVLSRRLQRWGHDVAAESTGRKALEYSRSNPCDVIILDLIMPDMNGFQVLEELKRDEHLHDIPVILVSDFNDTESVVRCIEAGAEDYLLKPFNPVLLRARVNACLEQKRWRDRERRYLERLRHEADHDALTGLPNRKLFERRLNEALEDAERDRTKVALLYVDLDGFKAVNDTRGHDAGDAVLKEASDRLCESVRKTDTVARLGGDEFAVILTDVVDRESAAIIGRKLVESLSEPYPAAGKEARVGASIGAAIYPDHGTSSKALTKAADVAMYGVKSAGKGDFALVG